MITSEQVFNYEYLLQTNADFSNTTSLIIMISAFSLIFITYEILLTFFPHKLNKWFKMELTKNFNDYLIWNFSGILGSAMCAFFIIPLFWLLVLIFGSLLVLYEKIFFVLTIIGIIALAGLLKYLGFSIYRKRLKK
jgi:hypothetical protein